MIRLSAAAHDIFIVTADKSTCLTDDAGGGRSGAKRQEPNIHPNWEEPQSVIILQGWSGPGCRPGSGAAL